MGLTSTCIYTIIDEGRLYEAVRERGASAIVREHKRWVKGEELLRDAKAAGEDLAVVFADAADTWRLLGWAKIATIEVERDETRFTFRDLQPLEGHERSEFRVASTGEPLPDGHRRPYVLLQTPTFLNAGDGDDLTAWRAAPDSARDVFETLFPDTALRKAMESALARSIREAHAAAPEGWSLTLFTDLVRLNVGMPHVLNLAAEEPSLLAGATPRLRRFIDEQPPRQELQVGKYGSVPSAALPHAPAPLFPRMHRELWDEHAEAIRLAAARNPTMRRSGHSEGVLLYLREVGQDVPLIASANRPSNGADGKRTRGDEGEDETPFAPANMEDGRKRILQSIVQRQGQGAFRREVLAAYEGRCALTGCNVEDVLEAAHIVPYRGEWTNHVGNGLLLRADLHTLFDKGLLKIEPETHAVRLSPALSRGPYADLQGAILHLPRVKALRPSEDALRERWQMVE